MPGCRSRCGLHPMFVHFLFSFSSLIILKCGNPARGSALLFRTFNGSNGSMQDWISSKFVTQLYKGLETKSNWQKYQSRPGRLRTRPKESPTSKLCIPALLQDGGKCAG